MCENNNKDKTRWLLSSWAVRDTRDQQRHKISYLRLYEAHLRYLQKLLFL